MPTSTSAIITTSTRRASRGHAPTTGTFGTAEPQLTVTGTTATASYETPDADKEFSKYKR